MQREDPHQLTAASQAALRAVPGLANSMFYGGPQFAPGEADGHKSIYTTKGERITLTGQCRRVETAAVREADVYFHQVRTPAGRLYAINIYNRHHI